MLLPDPRKEVIVKRVLDDKTVQLWWPGNTEALEYNKKFRDVIGDAGSDYIQEDLSIKFSNGIKEKRTVLASASLGYMDDEMDRKTEYTKPRTIKLDTKYEGAILLNIWPNYAIQIVNKAGDRRVVEGPKVIMLEYDETLETLELSTGKPKTDHSLMKTAYLQTKNNVVSDIIEVETKDLIRINIRISYKVDFESDNKNWFKVSDYVKLLTQHMRSLVRNVAKKQTVEYFNENATDIIRDTILGESKEGGRLGRKFKENDMRIYDVEVLSVDINDVTISKMLVDNQHMIVSQNLNTIKLEKELEHSKKVEIINREKLDEKSKTFIKQTEIDLLVEQNTNKILTTKFKNESDRDTIKHMAEKEIQEILDFIVNSKVKREKVLEDLKLDYKKEYSNIHMNEVKTEMEAIQPGLIEALIATNDIKLAEILAKNIKEQKSVGGLGELFSGKSGGWEGILETIKGTPLEERLTGIIADYKTMKSKRKE
jgi:major vault protein